MAEGRDGRVAHFKILTYGIVSGDVGLDFVAQTFVDGSLPGNRRLARGFGPSPCLFNFAPAPGSGAAHFCGPLTLAEFMPGALFKFGYGRSLVASIALAFSAHFAL
jgi:hypothetical protein